MCSDEVLIFFRLGQAFCSASSTLTKIDFSRGYGKLDVYISSSSSKKKKTILHTMNIAKRRIVSRALSGLRLRKIPKLAFFWDDTVEKAFKINEILNKSLPND